MEYSDKDGNKLHVNNSVIQWPSMSGRTQEYVQVPFVTASDGQVCRVWCAVERQS